eukprot:gene31198-6345_t
MGHPALASAKVSGQRRRRLEACSEVAATTDDEIFTEEVMVHPMGPSHKMVHFHFKQSAPILRHHATFPRTISRLAAAIPFEEVQLFFTHGRWFDNMWGESLWPVKPGGMELSVRFPASVSGLASHWVDLTHALSGQFCASINLLSDLESVAVRRHYSNASSLQGSHRIEELYASMPKEAVCAENLTPWAKLLPCQDNAGLASLLKNRQTLYSARYHSMGTRIQVMRNSTGGLDIIHLTQTLTLVIPHPAKSKGPGELPPHEPSLPTLMHASLADSCPIAQISRFYMPLVEPGRPVDAADGVVVLPTRLWVTASAHGGTTEAHTNELLNELRYEVLDLEAVLARGGPEAMLMVHFTGSTTASRGALPKPRTTVQRYLTGQGNLRGRMVLDMRINLTDLTDLTDLGAASCPGFNRPDSVGTVCIFQVVPWFVRLWLHTLTLTVNSEVSVSENCHVASDGVRLWLHTLTLTVNSEVTPLEDLLVSKSIKPAVDRHSSLSLELCFHVPAPSTREGQIVDGCLSPPALHTWSLIVDFTKSFLTVTEHPPDAHRGFDVPAAVITTSLLGASQRVDKGIRWQSSGGQDVVEISPMLFALGRPLPEAVNNMGLLVQLATPDFSMPFNALCLTYTRRPLPEAVNSMGLLVQLATPDFSLPFNALCLTSTVLAVYADEGRPLPEAVYSVGLLVQLATPDFSMPFNALCLTSTVLAVYVDAGQPPPEVVYSMGLLVQLATPDFSMPYNALCLTYTRRPLPEVVYSMGLLVQLATPDFSMPYNVICLTSTVLAVYVGATMNTLMKRSKGAADAKSKTTKASPKAKAMKAVLFVLLLGILFVLIDPDTKGYLKELMEGEGGKGVP